MLQLNKDEDEGETIVQELSNVLLSINGHTFTFDSVADVEATQLDIFELVGAPLVENRLAGFNSSIFVYGHTGSGKTYTMWQVTYWRLGFWDQLLIEEAAILKALIWLVGSFKRRLLLAAFNALLDICTTSFGRQRWTISKILD